MGWHIRPARALVVALVGALVLVLGSATAYAVVRLGTSNDPDEGGYPQRIGFERPADPLPDRPGPLAATVYDNAFGAGHDLGVTASGRLWQLPGVDNLLSPSGTVLLSEPWRHPRRLAGHDLVSGERWELEVPLSWGGGTWSQDERLLLSTVTERRPRREVPVVLDVVTGELQRISGGRPAGFRAAAQPVTVRAVGSPAGARRIVVTTTDLLAGRTSALSLRPASPWQGDQDRPLVASVAPDGRSMLLVEEVDAGTATVRVFAMSDGTELASRTVEDWDGCTPTWLGRDPVLPTTIQPGGPGSTRWAGARRLTATGPTDLVAVHPRLQSTCLQLTTAALADGPRWSLFGTSTALWTWYPVPAALAVLLLALGAGALAWLARRAWARRRRRGGNSTFTRRQAPRLAQNENVF